MSVSICCCQLELYHMQLNHSGKKGQDLLFYCCVQACSTAWMNTETRKEGGMGWGSLSGTLLAFTGSVSTVTDWEHGKGLCLRRKHLIISGFTYSEFSQKTLSGIPLCIAQRFFLLSFILNGHRLRVICSLCIVTMVQWNLSGYDFNCLWLGMYGSPFCTSLDFVFDSGHHWSIC